MMSHWVVLFSCMAVPQPAHICTHKTSLASYCVVWPEWCITVKYSYHNRPYALHGKKPFNIRNRNVVGNNLNVLLIWTLWNWKSIHTRQYMYIAPSTWQMSYPDNYINSVSFAPGHKQCSPSVQYEWDQQFPSVQQCPHTVVLAVAFAAYGLLSESRTCDIWISSSQHSSVPKHQPVLQ